MTRGSLLGIHHFILMIDTFHVHRVKIFGNEFLAQTQFISFFEGPFQNCIPPVGLQNGNIIFFFVLTDFFRNFHSFPKDLHQFIIELIDLLS